MKNISSVILVVLLLSLVLVNAAVAKTVYLSDGSVIENVKSVWRSEGEIHVIVAPDAYLTLLPQEVNLKKTFKTQRAKAVRKVVKRNRLHAVSEVPSQVTATAVQAAPVASQTAAETNPSANAPAAAQTSPQQGTANAPAAQAGPQQAAPATPQVGGAKEALAVAGNDNAAGGQGSPKEQVQLQNQESASSPEAQRQAIAAAMSWKSPYLQVFLLLIVISIATFWKVYEKAGEAGWKSLIPVYNMMVLLRIAGKPVWWILLLFVPLINFATSVLLNIALAKRFGKGPLFGIGLTFLPPVFFAIIAFDKSVYDGPAGLGGRSVEVADPAFDLGN